MFQLLVNDIIEYANLDGSIRERILWIDLKNDYCYTIQLETSKIIIHEKSIQDLNDGFNNNALKVTTNNYDMLVNVREEYEEKHKESVERKYEIIKFILSECGEPNIFERKYRGKVVAHASNKFELSSTVIYKYLRLYWQGGKLKSALLPKYNNSGAPGREKNFTKKTGRPSYEEMLLGKRIGIPLTKEIINTFEKTLERYYRNQKGASLQLIHKLMIKDFFTDIIDGEVIARSKEVIPSFNQFYNWYRTKTDIKENVRKRLGDRKHELKNRELPSDTLQGVLGPGSRYEIDATRGDIYLVSRIDRKKVLGRPTVYLVGDVFSRLITGVYISFEDASWNGAASALFNCAEDKKTFCEKYGINMESYEWPAQGLPEIILADRGELIGPIAEPIISKLNITTENTPTGRGDRKPVVEQSFHRVHARIKAVLPGVVMKDHKERGDRDYRLDAKLDIYEFTQIVILSIKNMNKSIIDDYQLTREMIEDGVKPIPIELWKWGMLNKTGKLRKINEDLLKKHLMRQDTASITERGIKFKKMLYSAELAKNEGWFEVARIEGYKNIPIVYDNRDMTFIYFYDSFSGRYIQCQLKDEYSIYRGLTLEEIQGLNVSNVVEKSKMQDYSYQVNTELYSEIDKILKNNAEKTNGKSGIVSIKDMKKNKKAEIKEDYEINKRKGKSEIDNSINDDLDDIDEIENITTSRELDILNNLKMRRKRNE